MKRILRIIILALALAALCAGLVFADEVRAKVTKAEGFGRPNLLKDGDHSTYTKAQTNNRVVVTAEGGISSLYVEFDRFPMGAWTITDTASGKSAEIDQPGFLHQYADVKALLGTEPAELTINFAVDAYVSDVYGFSGETPDWVQRWEAPLDEADLLLLTTHSDDEQLFFAGLLPYYAVERKMDVQVVYFIQHFNVGNTRNYTRPHELLDGLWAVGIRNYPYISEFPDIYAEGKDREATLGQILGRFAPYGYEYNDFLDFTVGVLRRFKPLVVVSHDLDGEYGHGAHILNADVLCNAVTISGDAAQFPESAEKYGVWTPDKLYLHLYPENPVVMDWDTPYESMGGKTPFQMTQKGFSFHKSQHWTWFNKWINGTTAAPITKASQIATYSPCNYGLYFTNVGTDLKGNDMFENVPTYAERYAAAEAERKRLEEEAAAKKAAEEEAARQKAEAEAKAAEDAQRAKEEQARIEEEARKRRNIGFAVFGGVAVIGAAAGFFLYRRPAKREYID